MRMLLVVVMGVHAPASPQTEGFLLPQGVCHSGRGWMKTKRRQFGVVSRQVLNWQEVFVSCA